MTPEEEAGVRLLHDAYKRWEGAPPLRFEIPHVETYALLMACQGMIRHPAAPPFMVEAWECLGRQFQERLCDTPELYALCETGWNRDLDTQPDPVPTGCAHPGCGEAPSAHLGFVLGHQYEAEEQPATPADATATPEAYRYTGPLTDASGFLQAFKDIANATADGNPAHDPITPEERAAGAQLVDGPGCTPRKAPDFVVDVTRPYCYRIDRPAEHRPEGEFMMSWGSWDTPPGPIRTAHHAATYQGAVCRIQHSYWGPMRVRIWQKREGEHYRQEPPADAYSVDLTGGTTADLAARKLVAEVEGA